MGLYWFSRKYFLKCLINFIIDSSHLSPSVLKKFEKINKND